jgi:hypothetical protein
MKQQMAAFMTLLVAGSLAIGASDPTVPYPGGLPPLEFSS